MKFTVLGAAGFIGRNLVTTLERAGHDVLIPHRDSSEVFASHLGHVLYGVGVTADFRRRPFDTMRAHVGLLTELLDRASFDSLLYLSSTRVYARSSTGREDALVPVDVSDPSDLYNLSKLAGESLCRCSGRAGVKVARLSNVVGYNPGSDDFLFVLIREALSGRIALRSDPASSKDYIPLEDVVSILPKLAVEGRHWLYNVAAGANLAHSEIIHRLVGLTGCEVVVEPGAPRHDFPTIDARRLQGEFAFAPTSVLDVLPQLLTALRSSQ